MTHNPKVTNRDWSPCQAGDVQRLVKGLRRERRRRTLSTWSLPVLAVVFVGLVVHHWGHQPARGAFLAGIWCADVQDHAAAYVSGELDSELKQQMRDHIAHCPDCQKMMDEIPSAEVIDDPTAACAAQTPDLAEVL